MRTHPLDEKWWHEAQYRRSLANGVTVEQVDAAMQCVAEVFDIEWCSGNRDHPAYFHIHSRGTNPLGFLTSLGMDLISVKTCLRQRQLVEDLKKSDQFSSAHLELFIASRLQACGHCVELRPELPTGKNADLLTKEDGLGVYFEIKQLSHSNARKFLGRFSQELLSAIARFQTLSGMWPKDAGYHITVSDRMLESLDAGDVADRVLISEVVAMVMTKLKARLSNEQLPFAFDVRSYVNVRVAGGLTSQLSGPVLAPEPELKRVLQKHFKTPNEQLRPDHPGILLIQSASALDPVMTRTIIGKLMEQGQPAHLSAAIFVSVLPPDSMAYVFFPAFAVANPRAQFPARELKAFRSLCDIFGIPEPS